MQAPKRTFSVPPVDGAAPVTSAAKDIDASGTGRVVLLWVLCLLPIILFAGFALDQRKATLRAGENAAKRTVQVMEEHALRVFEAQQLIIDQVDQYLGDMDWTQIRASQAVHLRLKELAKRSPHVDGLWLVPPDGHTANSADFFPFPDVSVTDRTYFQVLSTRDELHYGEMIKGRTKGTFNFNLSRRRSPRDTFNGVILVTSSLQYFTDFWQQASEGDFVAGLFRQDGEILARYPMLESLPRSLGPDSSLLAAMQHSDDGVLPSISSLDGVARIYGFSRIGDTPLFIGYGISNAQILASWRREMLPMGLIALLATVLLGLTATTILRQNRRLGATALLWRRTATELEREVDKRLRAEDVAAERKRLLDEVRGLTAQRQSILENIAEGVIALDARGRVIYANRDATTLLGPFPDQDNAFAGLVATGRIRAVDGTDLSPASAPDKAPLRGENLAETEFLVQGATGQSAICSFRGGAIFGADGKPEGAVLTFWDVSERKREAERRELLMRELDHRVRNMLATIMAMIRISNLPHQSKEAFIASLTGRVAAMARTHGVLSEGQWKGATVGRIVADEVASIADARQLVIDGDPDVLLPPKQAADLALALHELATNATKHGAWSVPEGKITLAWSSAASAEGRLLRVRWQESGGPPILAAPSRKGFGTSLLHGLFGSHDGVTLEYATDGFSCDMSVPIEAGLGPPPSVEVRAPDLQPPSAEAPLAGVRVLVVEDEAVVRLDLVHILLDAGAIITAEAGSLDDGLDKARTHPFDAAVLDRNLGGVSSLPLARLAEEKGAAIVFVSGYRADAHEALPHVAGHIHLQKPITPNGLVAAILASVATRRNRA
ncbi:HWE histidine kinase domain-containing protein [Tabrizicola sp. BL-A-41-H6]|uniref:HWE histidine kinase domain-containing protein n=1 Tax=Tabrizicola sp. BL-A-41-H6 TaxID=3421107 RepID=UPI003D6746CD